MSCPSCGAALAQQMKFCNRCGSQLGITAKETDAIELFEKHMDSKMEGLFWSTVFGIALILGGMFLMKKFQFTDALIIAYMILSSAAFITYFGLGVWQVRRLARASQEAKGALHPVHTETNELNPAGARAAIEAAPSITEHTTHTLEPVPREKVTR